MILGGLVDMPFRLLSSERRNPHLKVVAGPRAICVGRQSQAILFYHPKGGLKGVDVLTGMFAASGGTESNQGVICCEWLFGADAICKPIEQLIVRNELERRNNL